MTDEISSNLRAVVVDAIKLDHVDVSQEGDTVVCKLSEWDDNHIIDDAPIRDIASRHGCRIVGCSVDLDDAQLRVEVRDV